MRQSSFKSLMRMTMMKLIFQIFLNMSTKRSVRKVCKEATVHILLTTVLSNQKHQY